MVLLPTLASTLLALVLAAAFGPLLGRLATQWFSGRGLTNLLTEVRGAFLPVLMGAILKERTNWDTWVVVGAAVGFTQAIAVARWIARRNGEWSPELIGGIALGRSRAALLSAQATARGAVVGTLAVTLFQIVLLEALLSLLEGPGRVPERSIGAAIFLGNRGDALLLVVAGTLVILGSEIATSLLFQRRLKLASRQALDEDPSPPFSRGP